MDDEPLQWPPLDDGLTPHWTGEHFELGATKTPVLCYHSTQSGWSKELTSFHEESIGADHYIDVASRLNALQSLNTALKKPSPVIMEVGCSSGFFLESLKKKAPHAFVIGADYISDPLFELSSKMKGLPLLQFDLTQCPFDKPILDGLVLLNVLEHIEDDELALQKAFRMLKPGGIAVIEVPAGPKLFDYYDSHLMHFRRYALKPLVQLVSDTGFEVLRASHLGFFLYPPFMLAKKLNRRKGTSMSEEETQQRVGQDIQVAAGNSLLHKLMGFELALGQHIQYPSGIRCLVTAQKPLAP